MKIPTLTLMMTLLILTVTGQKKVELKFIYQPLTRYDQTATTISLNTITYDCTEEMKQVLLEKGVEIPTIKSDTTVNRLVMSTGQVKHDGHFPIEINFESTSNKQLKELFPNGLRIYRDVPPNEFPQLDSLAADGADESMKQIFLETVQKMLSQFNFPAKKFKIGQSFKHKMPISIPILTASMDMEIISTYTLISITDGTAYFAQSGNQGACQSWLARQSSHIQFCQLLQSREDAFRRT